MEEFPDVNFPETTIDGEPYLEVCTSAEIPLRKGKNIYFDEETQVALFRVDGVIFAVSNICPHQHAAVIADGWLEETTITCPLHGWIYSLENGRALGGGARLKTYKAFERDGAVYLEKPKPVAPKWLDNF